MARKLKVYRTAIGFRDAYVAAPSQAAALRAWGTDKNLFARGAAEVVTDEALAAEPLSRPSEVITRARGTLAEQVAALGPPPEGGKRKSAKPDKPGKPATKAETAKRAKPRPSRAALEAAEGELEALDKERRSAERELREKERALAKERTAMEARFDRKLATLDARERRERSRYDAALRAWEP